MEPDGAAATAPDDCLGPDDKLAPLRVAAVGNVDSGKSTVLGRLLAEHMPREHLMTVQRYAESLGKASFVYAYLVDTHLSEM